MGKGVVRPSFLLAEVGPLTLRSLCTLGHNVASKAEVNAVMAQVHQAGAVITDPAHDAFWGGYTGSFQDPDGHVWEVAWNPDWELSDESGEKY
jgi:uncharacterized glyoxalase superfamily protein PhnB